ncbi:alpha/beta hydrolase [Jiangella anatolica]|uniref:alpha/beta hydrolase n=1 Tax=Jiangella anatolica TaxID=2670374 RepID=UPI0018F3C8A1|nr:alpha/beta hydrolase [Jiangella anatolica]
MTSSTEVAVAERAVPGPHGAVRVRVYTPPGDPAALLVWLHGGGFAGGDLDIPEAHVVAGELAARTPAVVVSVGYRLARDGVRYPVPVDDAAAAWRWAAAGGVPAAGPRAIGGASAGAAIALTVALRQRGTAAAPDRLLLAYPFAHFPVPALDAAMANVMRALPPELRFDHERIAHMVRTYVGRVSNLPAEALPGAANLTGLPPAAVVLSELDDLRPSGELLVEQLRESGVEASVQLEKGMPHGHLNSGPPRPGAGASLDFFAAALRPSGLDGVLGRAG